PLAPWLTCLALTAACVGGDGEPSAVSDNDDVVAGEVAAITSSCGQALPISATVVSGAQVGNPGTNAVDGNLATRWSQNELGATITVDLGALKNVCAVDIAWYTGDTRTSSFAVALSPTGASFTEVLARSSTGTTAALEGYAFAPRDARFVRVTVFGNSTSNWASISELAVAGGPPSKLTAAQRDALVYGNYKPSAATVGPVPEVTLTQLGTPSSSTDFVVTANNQVVQNLEIWGRVDVDTFSNVTIKNCIIHGTLQRGVGTAHVIGRGNDLRGATIIDSALVGRSVTVPAAFDGVPNPDAGTVNRANEWSGGINGGNYTVLRTEIRNTSDGLSLISQVGNATAKGCWIHDGWFNEWTEAQASPSSGTARYYPYSTGTAHYTHVDGIQFHRGRNYTFVGNLIGGTRVPGAHNATPSEKLSINTGDDMYNAALMIKQEVDATAANKIENVLIDRNWFQGGAATINITWGNNNHFETVTLSNNRFTRSTWGNQFYVLRSHDDSGVGVGNFSNNVFEDDGTPVTISNGN
ncbi:MAG: discoidin domain-containing protein, partial [Kofleriaceae bacterium]